MRLLPLLALVVACDPATPTPTDPPYQAVCTEPTEVSCDIGADLPFHDAVSDGTVQNQVVENDWVETVDARAGGFIAAPDNPWLYVRFGDNGMEKVELTDFEANTSMDWDVAFHRYNIRLNSGSSGSSCVQGGPAEGTYDALDLETAQSTALSTEAFYDGSCTYIDQEFEEPEAPQNIPVLALQEWWTYPDCVATTGTPMVVQLASGRLLKLEVLAYYGSNQQQCNDEGTIGAESALLSLKWTYLQ